MKSTSKTVLEERVEFLREILPHRDVVGSRDTDQLCRDDPVMARTGNDTNDKVPRPQRIVNLLGRHIFWEK